MADKTITVKLVKSLIGSKEKQLATAAALGLRKIGDTTEQPDNAATKGKLRVLAHLIEVTE
ncbi:MAG: 50S ribosomal protein L30 [Oscillospiraceae bacterium]|jgi:ribosomal protein L30|nr:50S ribosomal protein L30 [Oscillospiraceae bacterium]